MSAISSQSLRGQYSFSEKEIFDLCALQELAVRLYFSDSLVEELKNNDFDKIGADWKKLLPDLKSEFFAVESFGRRVMIARELVRRFKKTFALLAGAEVRADQIVSADFFKEFISSDYFLTPFKSLPHPYGLGAGYENVSKFFFWAQDRYDLRSVKMLERSTQIRSVLYLEFSFHLLSQIKHATEPWYKDLGRGIFFSELPNAKETIVAIDLDFQAKRIASDISKKLLEAGFVNLDSIETFEQTNKLKGK